MPLPQLETPTYKLNLPSTGKEITFRPWTVGEEKVMRMSVGDSANPAEDVRVAREALRNLLKGCIETEMDIDTLTEYDIEYIFLHIRGVSVSKFAEFSLEVNCPEPREDCPERVNVEVNLREDVKVIKDENRSFDIRLDNKVGIIMQDPNLGISTNIRNIQEDMSPDDIISVIVKLIVSVYDVETGDVYPAADSTEEELTALIEKLTIDKFAPIMDFINTMPYLKVEVEAECPVCGHTQVHSTTDTMNFFE